MALQLAKAAGARVSVVDNAKKVEWLAGLGADELFDYAKTDFTRCGQKWDRILDMVATRGPRALSRSLAAGGKYMALGGDVLTLLSIVFGGPLFARHCSIRMLLVPSGRDLTDRVVKLAIEGRIAPQLEYVLPLSSVPDALMRTGKGEVLGKVVINPTQM